MSVGDALLPRAAAAADLALDHVGLVHELAQPLVEVLVNPVGPTWLLLPIGICALDRQIDSPVILDLKNLHVDLLSLGEVGVNVLDEVAMDFGNMYQPRDIGRDLDERTEILKPDYLALNDGSWLD
jgi:hypothetical protein